MHKPAMTAAARLTLAGTAVLVLGGCHSLFAWHRPLTPAVRALETRSDVYLADQLAAGRVALEEGRHAEAIAAFSRLRGEPGYDAEACNGLAVAWAGIGRDDLAAAYFRRALALAPGEQRYRRNLALFEARQETVRAARAALAELAAIPWAPPVLSQATPAAVKVASGMDARITRISKREILLQAAPGIALWEAPHGHPKSARSTLATRQPTMLPVVTGTHGRTFAMGARAAPAGPYPVRIVFGRAAVVR